MCPATPVPVNVGRVEFCGAVNGVITGGADGVASIVIVAVTVFTASHASVCRASSATPPSGSGIVGMTNHRPSASTVVTPISASGVPGSRSVSAKTRMVVPGSPVPAIVGVVSLVGPSVLNVGSAVVTYTQKSRVTPVFPAASVWTIPTRT